LCNFGNNTKLFSNFSKNTKTIMSEWATVKILKSVHEQAVKITQENGQYLGRYLSTAIQEQNNIEQEVLDRMQEKKVRQETRQRYGVR
jgi:cell division septum initiation protein DivIVA